MRTIITDGNNIRYDSALSFGRGVFETILIKDRPIFFMEHMKRLNNGILSLKIGEPLSEKVVEEYIENNKISDGALKVIVTEKNIVFAFRKPTYTKEDYINGFKVKKSTIIRNSTSKATYLKSLNYLDNILQYEEAHYEGYNEALFFNEKKQLCEGCTTNVFLVKGTKIYTPKIESGLLPGVVRKWVIENYEVQERFLTHVDITKSDEIFLTNSIVGIIKVSEYDGVKVRKCNIGNNIRLTYEKSINKGGFTHG